MRMRNAHPNGIRANIRKNLAMVLAGTFVIRSAGYALIPLRTHAADYPLYGIDISSYQTVTDWNSVQDAVDFVMIRCGTTTGLNNDIFEEDTSLEAHYSGAEQAGIPVGFYYYSGAGTAEGFRKNANEAVRLLADKTANLPVFLDLEQSTGQMALGKDTLTAYALEALSIIKEAGFKAGVYANLNWLTKYIDGDAITDAGYEIWMAQYPSGDYAVDPNEYDKQSYCCMWQYSDRGSISGINGNVDVDVFYGNRRTSDPEFNIPYPRPDGSVILRNGSSGKFVSWLQTALNLLYDAGLIVTGNFDSATEQACKEAQSKLNLTSDGLAGKQTIGACVAALKEKYGEQQDAEPDQPIPAENTQARITASETELNLDLSGAATRTITLTLENIPKGSTVRSVQTKEGIISAQSGKLINGDVPFTVVAKACGENDLTLEIVLDEKVLTSVTIHISVHNSSAGDTDCNGEVNLEDALLLLKWLKGGETSAASFRNADLDSNGKINVEDLTILKRGVLLQAVHD